MEGGEGGREYGDYKIKRGSWAALTNQLEGGGREGGSTGTTRQREGVRLPLLTIWREGGGREGVRGLQDKERELACPY